MSCRICKLLIISGMLSPGILGTITPSSAAPSRTVSVEKETAWISKHLKPISDDDWKNVAGTRVSEKYEITKGDTLYGISKQLFGDAKYWPKVWALNNSTITNPHWIKPGNLIAFMPGSGTSLPSIAIHPASALNEPAATLVTETRTPSTNPNGKTDEDPVRSTEWMNLPRQSWENVPLSLPAEVDAQGFDKRSLIRTQPRTGFDLPAIAVSEKIPTHGQIIGSRSEGNYISIGDAVYISDEDILQVGETYAIIGPPSILKSRKSDRVGYSYEILGKVKIIGVKDGQFIGNIINARETILRGSKLIPVPARIQNLTPIPGPDPLESILLLDKNFATFTVAQHKQVFMDRGTQDGIEPGMIFRAYAHKDPGTNKTITTSDYIINADIMVIQTSERFSSGIIIRSLSPITEGTTVVLLTDVTDVLGFKRSTDRPIDQTSYDRELDDLDRLDGNESLGSEEKKELKQLENWKQNPTAEPVPTSDVILDEPPAPESSDAILDGPSQPPSPETSDAVLDGSSTTTTTDLTLDGPEPTQEPEPAQEPPPAPTAEGDVSSATEPGEPPMEEPPAPLPLSE